MKYVLNDFDSVQITRFMNQGQNYPAIEISKQIIEAWMILSSILKNVSGSAQNINDRNTAFS